ncbi:MAG: molybdenum cofactor biosynthesis protein MoaE [Methanolinea sp.]|nr:molybdenum cofactor biosynthesis protein MoaE [Methanolinea sp.]
MIRITREDFDPGEIIAMAREKDAGAIVSFLGTVRDDGIDEMEVEAYEEVAERDLAEIAAEARERFGILGAHIIHRTGHLRVGENIVMVVTAAPHRREAFRACEYIIDRIKERVPIWKKEHTPAGSRWVQGEHHG